MNLDELENNRQDDQHFQDDSRLNEGMEIESPSVDHSITEYAEPDYGNDLSNDEINNTENPDEFDNDGFENGGNTEFDNEEEFENDQQDDADLTKRDSIFSDTDED